MNTVARNVGYAIWEMDQDESFGAQELKEIVRKLKEYVMYLTNSKQHTCLIYNKLI